jgi:hypothetical protein
MSQTAAEELRDFARDKSSDKMAELATILLLYLQDVERMNHENKTQTEAGFHRLEKDLKDLGTQVSGGFEKIFQQDDGLAGRITAIETELEHKPSHKAFYGALLAQLTLLVAIVFGLAQLLKVT